MISFNVDPTMVVLNTRKYIQDFSDPYGVLGREIQLGMYEVYERVSRRFKKLYTGQRRRYIDSNANYKDKAAPRTVKWRITSQLQSEDRGHYSIAANSGLFVFGLGNVETLDEITNEIILSRVKAARQETPEQHRIFPGRDIHSIWRVIEFGAKPHAIGSITGAGSPYSDDPMGGGLMFFNHQTSSIAFADKTQHPGQSGKHVFLRAEHEIYQKDIDAITRAILRGLKSQIFKYHGTRVR